MGNFKFRLQKVLELRLARELEQAGVLADARRAAAEAERVRELLEQVREIGQQQIADAHGTGGTAGQLQNLNFVLERLGEQLDHADVECRSAADQVASELSAFSHALRDRRVLDQLRERQLATWRSAQVRQEQKTMDDVAATRHVRANEPAAQETGT
jgi:flagellar export protein FliJ